MISKKLSRDWVRPARGNERQLLCGDWTVLCTDYDADHTDPHMGSHCIDTYEWVQVKAGGNWATSVVQLTVLYQCQFLHSILSCQLKEKCTVSELWVCLSRGLCCCFSLWVMSDSSVTPWTAAHQAALSMGFPRQESWSGLPFSCPGDLPNPGIKPMVPTLIGGFFTIWATREAPLGPYWEP